MTYDITDPLHAPRFVRAAPIAALVEALADPYDSLGYVAYEWGEVRFRCPEPGCDRRSSNGGSAQILSTWHYKCDRCRKAGTRWLLEQLVLHDATAVENLMAILAEQADVPARHLAVAR